MPDPPTIGSKASEASRQELLLTYVCAYCATPHSALLADKGPRQPHESIRCGTVCTWAASGFIHVEIADTGQGIQPENLARIYDPFFTTKAAKKGTGLGLSITYGIVHEHSGVIEVDSNIGQGTCFRLEFPALEHDRALGFKAAGNLVSTLNK
jgi:signal transduction histidine kinase